MAALLTLGTAQAGRSQTSEAGSLKPPVIRPAVDGIMAAFETHPVVAVGDAHGLAQELDFYGAIIRDPRFAREVGNVVVEFGGAAAQDIVDRYVAGESVPYTELRKVWTEQVGFTPTVQYVGMINLYVQVRAVNRSLPPDQRIRVWLGDPPIDWSRATRADLDVAMARRNSYPAQLIQTLLAKNQKTLVIYGDTHIRHEPPATDSRPRKTANPRSEAALRRVLDNLARGTPNYTEMTPAWAEIARQRAPREQAAIAPLGPVKSMTFKGGDEFGRDYFEVVFANGQGETNIRLDADGNIAGFTQPATQTPPGNIRDQVERLYPNAFFVVQPYTGYIDKACSEGFEAQAKAWPVPALATPVRGASLERVLRRLGCDFQSVNVSFVQTMPKEEQDRRRQWAQDRENDIRAGLYDDALLYLGPAASLTRSPISTDIYLDIAFREEISRRLVLRGGQPLGNQSIDVTPRKIRSY